jgi:hypothetical protein
VRHFTVEEANALIPLLAPVLLDLREVYHRFQEAVDKIEEFEVRAGQNGHGEGAGGLPRELDLPPIKHELEQRLNYLSGIGVQLKDIEEGVLDFPSRMYGQDVLLCWRLGESEVAHWHSEDDGFAGRRPL